MVGKWKLRQKMLKFGNFLSDVQKNRVWKGKANSEEAEF